MHQDNIEYRVKHIDGSWRWHTSSAIPIKDSQGTISGFEGTATDITDRKQLTENLMLSTERLTLATHAANIGIWDYDPTNNKLIWDEQMYKLYGLNADKFTGAYESWKAGLHPDDLQRSDHEIQMALRGEKEFDTEFRVLWPDKTVKYIRAIANVLRDPTGKALRMIGTNWDITDQKTIGEELLNKINELEKLNSLMIGRELKMIELKDEIAKLKSHINKVTKPTEDS